MIKKKYFVLLVTLLLVFCLGLCSTSLGAVNKTEVRENLNKIKDAGLITGIPDINRSEIGSLLDQKNNYAILITDGQGSVSSLRNKIIVVACNGDITTYTNDSRNGYYNNWKSDGSAVRGNAYTLAAGNSETGALDLQGAHFVYAYTTVNINTRSLVLNAGAEYGQNILIPQIFFTPDYDSIITINQNNNVNALKYGYSVAQWKIGETTGFDDLYYYEMTLYDNVNQVYIGTSTGSGLGTFNNNALYYNNDKLYVNSRFIRYNQLYWLNVLKYKDRNTFEEENYWFYFLPPNAVIENGVIVSSGDGSFDTQDSTNNIINNLTDTEQAENTTNDFFSGDSNSFASKIGYNPIENPFVTIIRTTLQTITDTLLGSGNETLTIGFGGSNYYLHSEDFTLPNGIVKTFISVLSNGFFVWIIVKYGFQLYQWINSGRLQNLVNEANGHWYKSLF